MKPVRYTVYRWMESGEYPDDGRWINLGIVEDESEETAECSKKCCRKTYRFIFI